MKYICLGYIEPGTFEGMTEGQRNAVLDECFEHNDHLRANGHLVAEVALQPPETALTLYWKNGKVATTDGPYAETKEQLGGIVGCFAGYQARVRLVRLLGQPDFNVALLEDLVAIGGSLFIVSRF